MLTKVSINILVQINEQTYAFKRKESSPRKSMYVIINHFEMNQPSLTFSPSNLPALGSKLQPLDWHERKIDWGSWSTSWLNSWDVVDASSRPHSKTEAHKSKIALLMQVEHSVLRNGLLFRLKFAN